MVIYIMPKCSGSHYKHIFNRPNYADNGWLSYHQCCNCLYFSIFLHRTKISDSKIWQVDSSTNTIIQFYSYEHFHIWSVVWRHFVFGVMKLFLILFLLWLQDVVNWSELPSDVSAYNISLPSLSADCDYIFGISSESRFSVKHRTGILWTSRVYTVQSGSYDIIILVVTVL